MQEHHEQTGGVWIGRPQRLRLERHGPSLNASGHRLMQVAALALEAVAYEAGQRSDDQGPAGRARQGPAVGHVAAAQPGVGD